MKTRLFYLIIGWFLLWVKSVRAQEARASNTPSKTYSRTLLAEGPTVLGTFEGRFPCAEIYKDWKQPIRPECTKVKWGLTLYYDSETHQPTIYRLKPHCSRREMGHRAWDENRPGSHCLSTGFRQTGGFYLHAERR
jgi:hypothetical protein